MRPVVPSLLLALAVAALPRVADACPSDLASFERLVGVAPDGAFVVATETRSSADEGSGRPSFAWYGPGGLLEGTIEVRSTCVRFRGATLSTRVAGLSLDRIGSLDLTPMALEARLVRHAKLTPAADVGGVRFLPSVEGLGDASSCVPGLALVEGAEIAWPAVCGLDGPPEGRILRHPSAKVTFLLASAAGGGSSSSERVTVQWVPDSALPSLRSVARGVRAMQSGAPTKATHQFARAVGMAPGGLDARRWLALAALQGTPSSEALAALRTPFPPRAQVFGDEDALLRLLGSDQAALAGMPDARPPAAPDLSEKTWGCEVEDRGGRGDTEVEASSHPPPAASEPTEPAKPARSRTAWLVGALSLGTVLPVAGAALWFRRRRRMRSTASGAYRQPAKPRADVDPRETRVTAATPDGTRVEVVVRIGPLSG